METHTKSAIGHNVKNLQPLMTNVSVAFLANSSCSELYIHLRSHQRQIFEAQNQCRTGHLKTAFQINQVVTFFREPEHNLHVITA